MIHDPWILEMLDPIATFLSKGPKDHRSCPETLSLDLIDLGSWTECLSLDPVDLGSWAKHLSWYLKERDILKNIKCTNSESQHLDI